MSDLNDCDSWDNELIYDVINVLEAARDFELQHVGTASVEQARTLGLMDGDEITEKGKLLLLGWTASQSVAAVEKGLLFSEIEDLKNLRPGG